MRQSTKKKRFSIPDTGFSSKAEHEGKRLLNKDGSFNVKKRGLLFLERFSVFHWLIKMSWIRFFTVMFTGYLLINLLFASIYFLGDIKGLSGMHPIDKLNQFLQAFYFSSQTLTTVGYGYLSPKSTFHSMVAVIESFIGLMSFAMATGLLYGKFSKPKSGIIFSKMALISPYLDKGMALMIRLANSKANQLINVKSNMIISWIDPKSNGKSRSFFSLNLEIRQVNMFAGSWTVVHPIDEESPLHKISFQNLEDRDAEIILQISGYDESYSNEIHTATSYKCEELVWGAKYKKIQGQDGDYSTINLDEIGTFEKIEFENEEPFIQPQ
jgi:inward rectifier potassium channel